VLLSALREFSTETRAKGVGSGRKSKDLCGRDVAFS
jgi:hypothetical protein